MTVTVVMEVLCLKVLIMPQSMELLSNQNTLTLLQLKSANLKRLKLDINSMVLLKLNHSIPKLILKLHHNMLFLLVSMQEELISNYIERVSFHQYVMEKLNHLIMQLLMLDMHQIIIYLKIHGDFLGEKLDLLDLPEQQIKLDSVVFIRM